MELERQLETSHRSATTRQLRGAADHLALVLDVLGLVEVDAQPRGQQGEDVGRREVRVEMRGQRVEHGHDRIQELLEGADEAHPEVAILIQRREPVAQIRP